MAGRHGETLGLTIEGVLAVAVAAASKLPDWLPQVGASRPHRLQRRPHRHPPSGGGGGRDEVAHADEVHGRCPSRQDTCIPKS